MNWLLYLAGGVLLLFVLFLVWGFLHLRQSRNRAAAEIIRIELSEIPALAQECVDVFEKKLGVRLDLANCDESARRLDEAFGDTQKLKTSFAHDDFYWYFVKPVGAYLGELLRRHAAHEWVKEAGTPPRMIVRVGGAESEASPFEKILAHSMRGDSGDLVAYIEFGRGLNQFGGR
jgi:hypothetical protein